MIPGRGAKIPHATPSSQSKKGSWEQQRKRKGPRGHRSRCAVEEPGSKGKNRAPRHRWKLPPTLPPTRLAWGVSSGWACRPAQEEMQIQTVSHLLAACTSTSTPSRPGPRALDLAPLASLFPSVTFWMLPLALTVCKEAGALRQNWD